VAHGTAISTAYAITPSATNEIAAGYARQMGATSTNAPKT
jgi:hypothetical protein